MNDKNFDEYLNSGKKEAESFFSHIQLSSLRRALLHKVLQPDMRKAVPARKRIPLILKTGIAVAACAAVLSCVLLSINHLPGSRGTAKNASVAEQPLPLDEKDSAYHISFQPINLRQSTQPSLISILWKTSGSNSPRMVYNSIFENSDQPYPVSVLSYPGDSPSKLLLISTQGSNGDYIHYRLVEYYDETLLPLWSEDFVPGGRLTIQDGMVVEQRDKESLSAQQANKPQKVSYIVPYKVGSEGAIILPVHILHLHVGDRILLVGENNLDVEANSQNGLVKKHENEKMQAVLQNIIIFEAFSPGDDALSLTHENHPGAESLPVKIYNQ